MKKKECSKCGKIKSTSKFFMDKQKKDELSSACKKCVMIYTKQYYLEHKEHYLAYSKKHHEKTKHLKRERLRIARRGLFREIFDLLGSKCSVCNFDNVWALQIDHIKGGGYKHRKKFKSMAYYADILKSIKKGENKYRVLCANCNFIEGIKKGYRGSIWI